MKPPTDRESNSLPKVGFLGLSHLGLITSTALSSLGIRTVCYDENPSLVRNLVNLKTDINEPGLQELLKSNAEHQTFTNVLQDLHHCEIIYISTDVPTDETGKSDTSSIEQSVRLASSIDSNAIIVILSQVNPGFTRKISEDISNPLCYQVETLIFGDAVNRSLKQSRIILGIDEHNKNAYSQLFRVLELYKCPILINNLESAEFAKISINAFLASDVALTNTLSDLCERLGAQWDKVASALRLDQRIGQYRYLEPGLGISGGNIERDLRTITNLGLEFDVKTAMIDSIIEVNLHHRKWIERKLIELSLLQSNSLRIGLLGITYKKNTNSMKNSVSINLIQKFPKQSQIFIYDPVVTNYDFGVKNITFIGSAKELLGKVDILFILTPWDEFLALNESPELELMKNKIIIDPFNLLDGERCLQLGINHLTRGNKYQ